MKTTAPYSLHPTPSKEAGMTIIEVVMVSAVIGILALVISQFYVGRLVDYSRNFTKIVLQTNTKQAVETMIRDIKFAAYVEANNRWPDNNAPGAPGNLLSWQSTATVPATVVLAVPSRDASGSIIYVDALHNTAHTDDIIYYITNGKTLLRRVVANPVSGNAAKSTCPPASATPACPADAKVVEDVASLSAEYYDANNAITNTPSLAGSLQITLQQTRSSFGRSYNSSLTSRATMRNQ